MSEGAIMELVNDTAEILSQIEAVTGKPVEVIRDDSLPFLARITRARAGIPSHILRINPGKGQSDYLVAYEAGFILRQFANPPAERVDFAATDVGRATVAQMVKRAGQTARLPEAALSELTSQLYDGLMIQLRSFPIGMRIDQWLHDEHPALHALQAAHIHEQQRSNLQALTPAVRSFAPKPIWEANVAMNAAFATFADRLLGTKVYAIPYRSTGLEKRGRKLLDLLASIPSDPSSDRALVEAWATDLGLDGWFQWLRVDA